MKAKISPSMMCADLMEMPKLLRSFEANRVDCLHIDVMDGHFAPNYCLSPDYCKALRKNTSLPLDIHLMVENPETMLSLFPIQKNDIVSVHAESTYHLQKTLAEIRRLGAKAFIALNPATPISILEEILDDIDGVLVMAVNPGFDGQKFIPATVGKIGRIRAFLDAHGKQNAEIEVDGNVSFTNAKTTRAAGADIFVAGASSIFKPDLSVVEGIVKLRTSIGG